MVEIGKINTLEVNKEVEFGIYLDGHQYDEILLPKRYVPEGTKEGDEIDVFIYLDSEDRLIATTETPFVMVDECAYLEAVQCNSVGAFLDWGLPKDLFVPFKEQAQKMEQGKKYFVRVYVDSETDRIVASSKLNRHLPDFFPPYKEGDEVDVLIYIQTDLGYKAIIEDDFMGLIYNDEAIAIKPGDRRKAYIRKIRPDGKIDLSLQKDGYKKVDDNTAKILEILQNNNGYLPYHDKSPSDEIHSVFGMSKKTFKMVIGSLYKSKQIIIEQNGIRLL